MQSSQLLLCLTSPWHVFFPSFSSFLSPRVLCYFFYVLLCLLARKWVAESLTMGNLQARRNEESCMGTSQQTQGKCKNFSNQCETLVS